jgi:hypothetical protein
MSLYPHLSNVHMSTWTYVLIRFVSLDVLSQYVMSHYTFCLFRRFFRVRFVSLGVLLLHLLSLYVLSFRRFVVIRSVVRRFVIEPLMCILICTTYMPSKCGARCTRCIQTAKLRTVFCVLFFNILLDVNRAEPATF